MHPHHANSLSLSHLHSMPHQLTSCSTDSQCIMKRRKSPLLCRTKPPIETPISAVLWQRTCQGGQATVSLGWFSTVQTGWQKVKAPAICHCCARVKVSGVGTEGECSWADSRRDRPVWSETQQPVKQESKSGVFWGAKPLLYAFLLSSFLASWSFILPCPILTMPSYIFSASLWRKSASFFSSHCLLTHLKNMPA